MTTFHFDQDSYNRYLDIIPGEQAQGLEQFVQQCLQRHRIDALFDRGLPFVTASYTDAQGRDRQYWPLTAADQMWREAVCSQFNCHRPAAFVGVVDVLGDGALYYDSAAAWCYWCMPRDLMTPEAEQMARQAEWARRATLDECVSAIDCVWLDFADDATIDKFTTRLTEAMRHLKQTRADGLAHAMFPPEHYVGREPNSVQRYELRPGLETMTGSRIPLVAPSGKSVTVMKQLPATK